MNPSKLTITTKSSTERELHVKSLLEELLTKTPHPDFVSEVIIEEGAQPNSFAKITLNTRTDNPLFRFKVFVHEQFHRFFDDNPQRNECFRYLKKYPNLGEHSQYTHYVVCWNTLNFLRNAFSDKTVSEIYKDWQPYPLTEKFVQDNFEDLKKDLSQFDMVYTPKQ